MYSTRKPSASRRGPKVSAWLLARMRTRAPGKALASFLNRGSSHVVPGRWSRLSSPSLPLRVVSSTCFLPSGFRPDAMIEDHDRIGLTSRPKTTSPTMFDAGSSSAAHASSSIPTSASSPVGSSQRPMRSRQNSSASIERRSSRTYWIVIRRSIARLARRQRASSSSTQPSTWPKTCEHSGPAAQMPGRSSHHSRYSRRGSFSGSCKRPRSRSIRARAEIPMPADVAPMRWASGNVDMAGIRVPSWVLVTYRYSSQICLPNDRPRPARVERVTNGK